MSQWEQEIGAADQSADGNDSKPIIDQGRSCFANRVLEMLNFVSLLRFNPVINLKRGKYKLFEFLVLTPNHESC